MELRALPLRLQIFAFLVTMQVAISAPASMSESDLFVIHSPPPQRLDPQCGPGQPHRKEMLLSALKLRGRIAGHAGKVGAEITYDIYRLQHLMDQCGFTADQVAMTPLQIKLWQQSQLNVDEGFWRDEIEKQTEWRAADPLYLEILADKVQEGRVSSPASTLKFIAEQKVRGQAAEARERASCKPVNLGDKFGPSRNQDTVGWCFGFATADLFSYRLKKEISASDLSIQYLDNKQFPIAKIFSSKKESSYSRGAPIAASRQAMPHGLCLEANFGSRDNGRNSLAEEFDAVQEIHANLKKALAGACQKDLAQAHVLFPSLTLAELNNALLTSTKSTFIARLAEQACKPRVSTDKIRLGYTLSWHPRRPSIVLASVDDQLSKNNPVAIQMYGGSLQSGEPPADDLNDDDRASHSVMLIGRQFNEMTHQCEYLLRNSWGPTCGSMSSSFDCENESKGHVWVPRSLISASIVDATYLN